MILWTSECDACAGTGKIKNLGMIEKKCNKCKYQVPIKSMISRFKIWLLSNPFKTTPVGIAVLFFMVMLGISFYFPNKGSISVLAASFGSIFVALKYRLDQASYNKSLFEERYAIFTKIDELISAYWQQKDTEGNTIDFRFFTKELDSIYRKSYFLFGPKTRQFLDDFRKAILDLSYQKGNNLPDDADKKSIDEAKNLLATLIYQQNLSKHFPELKIDLY